MVGINIVNCLLFGCVLSRTYWITCFSVIAQDCIESVLYYARISLYTESSVEEQIQSIKVVVIYCIIAVVVLPLTFTSAQCMYKACLIQKGIVPKFFHCEQREWKRKNLKRINTRCWARMATKHVRKTCPPNKDTQIKDVKVAFYQLGDFQNQKPESNLSQKKSDKDK